MLRRNFWTSLPDLEPGMMKSLGSSGDGFRDWKSPILVSSSRKISTKIGKQFNHFGRLRNRCWPKNTHRERWVMKFACALSLTQDKGIVLTHVMVKGKTGVTYKWLKFKGLHQGQPCWIACETAFCVIFEGDITIFWKISLNMSAMLRNSQIPWHL